MKEHAYKREAEEKEKEVLAQREMEMVKKIEAVEKEEVKKGSEVASQSAPEVKEEKEVLLACFKCNGAKANKRGQPCKECGGAGVLQGEFFSGLHKVIQAEMEEYCNGEYRKLLQQELQSNHEKQSEVIHAGTTCHICKTSPITGVRYELFQLDSYDLCAACEAEWNRHQPVIKVRRAKAYLQPEPQLSQDKVGDQSAPKSLEKDSHPDQFELIEKPKRSSFAENPYVNQSLQQSLNPSVGGTFNSECLNKAEFKNLKYFCGSAFLLQWTFKNTSANQKDWPAQVVFKQIAGDDFGVQPFKINKSILNGAAMDLFVNFKAPKEPGTYNGFFRLCYGPGEIEFGEKVWIDLEAENNTDKAELAAAKNLEEEKVKEEVKLSEADSSQKDKSEPDFN